MSAKFLCMAVMLAASAAKGVVLLDRKGFDSVKEN